MTLLVREQVKYWGLAAAVLFVLLWLLGDVILPFLLGGAIAYMLDPIADALERVGFGRIWATAVITIFALLLFVALALLVLPTLVNQAASLIESAPQQIQTFQRFVSERYPDLLEADSTLRRSLVGLGETIQSRGGELINGLLASVSGLVNTLLLFVIVPVVAFYLLLDWDNMVARIDGLLPRDHAPTIRQIAREIDTTLASFIRGQGTVCLILGTFYAVALMLMGLQFGIVVGALAGALTFIPYVGALVGGGLAVGLALVQGWGDWLWVIGVAAIFQFGQLIEGNVLTPKLVGDSVGLHPVWLLFALAAFGSLFGFVGLLVAVPVAAALGVVARFMIAQYKDSMLYRGVIHEDEILGDVFEDDAR
ncbi:AI-2E family transporter [Profundibacterium mesophilum]|uniref:Lipocalin-related protein and BosCanEqu allergen n=1 Tax=Profundibacterium mesophilum KAUST100406-0324 TaxID=1037889 RepID=A0A921TBD8_9RHOB|nr:AI-2E family transporter [Profundibacterium mesophilum]KAF0675435.1 Lipocalin-related protein and BosCanEqu allergen [Profundibacterium mesophilum KAUST100406-0324]